MNYSAELAQSPSFFSRHISSRIITAICITPELLAIMQNIISLPLQCAELAVKIPAKIINLAVNSKSLNEFENNLAGPVDIIKTALKILGYAIGAVFTASVGLIISPLHNFKLHCIFRLVNNEEAINNERILKADNINLNETHEKSIETRLKATIEANRKKINSFVPMAPDLLKELEKLTKVPCPPISFVIGKPSLQPDVPKPLNNHSLEEVVIQSESEEDVFSSESESSAEKPVQHTNYKDIESKSGIDLEKTVLV